MQSPASHLRLFILSFFFHHQSEWKCLRITKISQNITQQQLSASQEKTFTSVKVIRKPSEEMHMIRNYFNHLRQQFLQLNLFKKHSSTQQTLIQEQVATRIFIITLPTLLLTITIAAALILRTVNITEYNPSPQRFQYLTKYYSHSLTCPCSKVGITYQSFVSTHTQFHQVCSSHFISLSWIETVLSTATDDFRRSMSFFWQTLAGLCNISNRTWTATMSSFGSSYIFSPQASSEDFIRSQTSSDLHTRITSAQTTLSRNLLAIRRTIAGNQFVSALGTNFFLGYPQSDNGIWSFPRMSAKVFDDCSCIHLVGCLRSAMINDTDGHSFTIPGIKVDCLIVDATLASTLECYYNETCLSLLHGSSSMLMNNLSLLSIDNNKYFSMNSSVQSIFDEMMIDGLSIEIDFDLFYQQCEPLYCAYSYSHRFDTVFIISTVLGVFGGILFALQYVSLFMALLILRYRRNRAIYQQSEEKKAKDIETDPSNSITRIRHWCSALNQKMLDLNLFESEHVDLVSRYEERLMTRYFLLVFVGCFAIFSFYIFIFTQEQIITVLQPNETEYRQLYQDYNRTLLCPCTQLALPYEMFLNVTYILHQVCSSDLVSPEWINYLVLFNPSRVPVWTETTRSRDFRTFGALYFQLLDVFCSLVRQNIEEQQVIFQKTLLINSNVVPPELFVQQAETLMNAFITTTNSSFNSILTWIDITNVVNQFLTGTNTNFQISLQGTAVSVLDMNYAREIYTSDGSMRIVGTCHCVESNNICGIDLSVYNDTSSTVAPTRHFTEIPLCCISINSFTQSTIAWWYQQQYIDDIRDTYSLVIYSQTSPSIQSLNQSVSTRFQGISMSQLLKQMFIERTINDDVQFDVFYRNCAPKSCTYKIAQRRTMFLALLLLLSVCGGINRALRLLVPVCIKSVSMCHNRCRDRHQLPDVSGINDNRYSWKDMIEQIRTSIRKVNLFQSTAQDPLHLHQQYFYTRIYIVILWVSLIVLIFYSSIIERIKSRTISLPSSTDYEYLLSLQPDTISCPCTQIAIPYQAFITQFNVSSFHQACDVSKIQQALTAGSAIEAFYGVNGSKFASWQESFYEGLSQLCQVAQENVHNSIETFLLASMFAYQVIPRALFQQEINATLSRFQTTLPIGFGQMLDLIRALVQGNALMGMFSSNWNIFMSNDGNTFWTEPVQYIDGETNMTCSCATQSSCSIPVVMYDSMQRVIVNSPAGIVFSCSLLESILHSTLSCLYSSACVNQYRRAAELVGTLDTWTPSGSSLILNSSTTRFGVNDSIETLAYAMFIESWTSNVSYEMFFNACAPSECTINYRYRFDLAELVTTFLSVYAGLALTLRFIVPHLVSLTQKVRNRCRNQVEPIRFFH